MKRWILWLLLVVIMLTCVACSKQNTQSCIATTTMPVYTFTKVLCEGTPLSVELLVQENVSCLHDYTLTVKHMKMLENADLIVISGAGLESFLDDALPDGKHLIDASAGISLHHSHDENEHDHSHSHHHDADPHFWLSLICAQQMSHNICNQLTAAYPQYAARFQSNLAILDNKFSDLQKYAEEQLSQLSSNELVTFHDGFSYMAEELGLTILKAVEEEAGSEASAQDLIAICQLVEHHNLPAVFVEKNGSNSAAKIIANETGAKMYVLDMAISGCDYFEAMYYNINTLKEALG